MTPTTVTATPTTTTAATMNRCRANDTRMFLRACYPLATARLMRVMFLSVPGGEPTASRGWRLEPVSGDVAEAVR